MTPCDKIPFIIKAGWILLGIQNEFQEKTNLENHHTDNQHDSIVIGGRSTYDENRCSRCMLQDGT